MPGLKLAKNKNTESPVFKISMFHFNKDATKTRRNVIKQKAANGFPRHVERYSLVVKINYLLRTEGKENY